MKSCLKIIGIVIVATCCSFVFANINTPKDCPSKEELARVTFTHAAPFGASKSHAWILMHKLNYWRVNFVIDLEAKNAKEALVQGQAYYNSKVILIPPEKVDDELCIYNVEDNYTVFTTHL